MMTKSNILKSFVSLMIVVLLFGCANLRKPSVMLDKAKYTKADIFVIYYPYPALRNKYVQGDDKIDFVPSAEFSTWHHERMDQDLSDMLSIGIDGVFLCLSPEDMADKSRREMISTFIKKCEESSFKVIFCMAPEKNMMLGPGNTTSYIESRKWGKSGAMYKLDGNVAVVFSETAMMSREMSLPGYYCLQMDLTGTVDQQGHPFTLVKSVNSVETMKNDRKKGVALITNLNAALATSSRIVLASWNNYSDGTAMERNRHDYDTLLKALK